MQVIFSLESTTAHSATEDSPL